MPGCDDSKSPKRHSPKECRSEKKCDTSKTHRTRRGSKSPEKCKVENKHKPDCSCKNCQAEKCPPSKASHFIEKFVFTSSTSGILVPFGATMAKIFMLGGGGGGGAYMSVPPENLHGGGGGGAAGSYEKECFAVKCGKSFDVKIGTGGIGGGVADSKDGGCGQDSVLTYDCRDVKTASGGKGGSFNLNGGFGGKGGLRSGNGEDGQNGKNGCSGGIGGSGGDADGRFCQSYGDGGVGGSNPDLLPLVPPTPAPPRHHRRSSRRRDCSRSPSRSPSRERKEPAQLAVGPNGANGFGGYCEVTFYADSAPCGREPEHRGCEDVIQCIKPCDESTTYWVNPSADVVVVDTSNFAAKLSLGKPPHKSHRVVIKLAHQAGLAAYITVSSGGTFVINSNNPSVTLFYSDCLWDVEANPQGVRSFYPTTQVPPTSNLDCYKGVQGNFTESVALSADGSTLAVGAAGDDTGAGAVWVYVKKGQCWEKQAKLLGTSAIGKASQGFSVALSADGSTLAVGGPTDDTNRGAVWIFVRSFSSCGDVTWTQQSSKLVNPSVTYLAQGTSVDLSADGNTLAVGAPASSAGVGATLVYTRSNCVWSQVAVLSTTDVLVAPAPLTPPTAQGSQVKLSADGTELVVGNAYSFTTYTLVAGVWTQFGSTVQGPTGSDAAFGIDSLALSADGYTVALGDSTASSGVGLTFVYVLVGGVWTQQGLPLQGLPANLLAGQGSALALSADGNTLAIGASDDGTGNNEGAVFIFTRTSTVWVQREYLVGPPSQGFVHQGASLALASEGNLLAVGNYVATGASPLFWLWN